MDFTPGTRFLFALHAGETISIFQSKANRTAQDWFGGGGGVSLTAAYTNVVPYSGHLKKNRHNTVKTQAEKKFLLCFKNNTRAIF